MMTAMNDAPASDPRDDPRTPWLLRVAPEEIGALAAGFQTAARESADTAIGLRAAQHDGHWTGHAAQAFRQSIGRLPGQLENIHRGYADVQRALGAYEDTLAELKPKFETAFFQYVSLRSELDTALRQDHLDVQTLVSQTGVTGITRRQRTQLERAVIADGRTVHGLQTQTEELRVQCQRLLAEFSQARHACHAAIASAAAVAPVAHRGRGGQGITVIGAIEGGRRAGQTGVTSVAPAHAGRHRPAAGPRGRAGEQIRTMTSTAQSLVGTPYIYGGGHGAWGAGDGLDCSGFVSAVLHSAGFLTGPVTTEGFSAQPNIATGPGRWVTIYDRTGCGANEHVILDIHGTFYEAGGGSASGGAPYVHQFTPSHDYLASFHTILHPVGL
jgi:cell wall-associated NlpC family hydrolase